MEPYMKLDERGKRHRIYDPRKWHIATLYSGEPRGVGDTVTPMGSVFITFFGSFSL